MSRDIKRAKNKETEASTWVQKAIAGTGKSVHIEIKPSKKQVIIPKIGAWGKKKYATIRLAKIKSATREKYMTRAEGQAGEIVNVGQSPVVYLGGTKNLTVKSSFETDQDYINLIRKGIPKKAVDHLIEATNIPEVEMAEIMETTVKKLAAINPDTIMEKSQSEKVVNIARLYSLGEEVFGSAEEFNKWMNGRVPSLGKKKPKEYLDTGSGISLLMDEISRIQHGVYS